MFLEILLASLLVISLAFSAALLWYIKKILFMFDEGSVELRERFRTFRAFMQETYKMDLFYGEPRLKELLDMIKEFDEWAAEYESRFIKNEEEEAATDDGQ